MTHPEETPEAQLFHFLYHRPGRFDTDMDAWLRQIAADDASAIFIEGETGQLLPMRKLAMYCAGQTLNDEIVNQRGFAKQFLKHAGSAFGSLRSSYLQAWVAELMDQARSAVARDAADSVLEELIKP